jgi:hypothetical protein
METFELLSVSDVRPLDWMTGKRLPVAPEDLPECARCGRRHAEVWRLRSSAGRELTVGSGCGPKLISEGLLPGVDLPAVKAAKRLAAAEVKRLRTARAEERAAELAAVARAAADATTRSPEPVWTAEDSDGWARETCSVGTSRRTVNSADLRKAPGEWGALSRESVERMARSGWLDGERASALRAAGCPPRALSAVLRLANAETDSTLRDAARALLP